jgi:hypothetical protein
MKRDEAVEHLGHEVLYEQGPFRYARGTVIGIVDAPSVLIEDPTGYRLVFSLESVKIHGRAPERQW